MHNFSLVLAYHTQGKEIYWQFQNYAPEDAEEIGNIFASLSGYTLADVHIIQALQDIKIGFYKSIEDLDIQ